jgi:threonine/homoserine/homoserine lactone efflux protein
MRSRLALYLLRRADAAYAAAMFSDFLPLATYCFLMSSTPGPNNVMLTASGANFGYRGTLPHIVGINLGGAVQTFAACLGLGALFAAWPVLHTVLRITGALYLLFLAWQLAGSALAEGRSARPLTVWQGALFQAVNPKSWMKAITVASVFMPAGWPLVEGALVVALVGLVVGFPCISTWALFGVAIRRWLQDPGRRRVFNAIMAATLALLALAFLR